MKNKVTRLLVSACVGYLCTGLLASSLLAETYDELDCVIEASELADVSTTVRGIVAAIRVNRGDWVEAGQVLATLESSVEESTVELAKAKAEAVYLIQARKARLDLAKKRLERATELDRSKAVSSQELDEAKTNRVLAQMEYEQAKEEQRTARLEQRRAEKVLALRTITSPVTGVVVAIHTSAGESVEDKPILRVARIDPLHVEAIAPVRLFGKVREQAVASIFPEEPIGGEFSATVSIVERILDAPSGTFGIRLILPNPEKTLPAGLRCKLRF
jgi:RND family efflux transporter MFP subunit